MLGCRRCGAERRVLTQSSLSIEAAVTFNNGAHDIAKLSHGRGVLRRRIPPGL